MGLQYAAQQRSSYSTPGNKTECLNRMCGMQSNDNTWHSCFQCHIDHSACTEEDPELLEQCNQKPGFRMLGVGKYAAQLAWWLNFFPPDRFLIVSSAQLWTEDTRMEVRVFRLCRVDWVVPLCSFSGFCLALYFSSTMETGRYNRQGPGMSSQWIKHVTVALRTEQNPNRKGKRCCAGSQQDSQALWCRRIRAIHT